MKPQLLLALPLLALQAGCTVTALSAPEDLRPSNTCESDADCRNEHCNARICQTLNGEIEGLLVAVTPPIDSAIPHLTYVTDVQGVPTGGGEKNLSLPGPSHLTGSLQLPKNPACYPTLGVDDQGTTLFKAPDGVSLPVEVTLALHQRLLGLPQQIYFAKTGSELKKGGYSFDVQVPAGEYDIYLMPPRGQLDCPVPPQLVRSKIIDQGAFEIPFLVAPISELNLEIHWPKTSPALKGWVADIIEPIGGNPISTQVTLGDPFDAGEASMSVSYTVELKYSPVVEPDADTTSVASGSDLFRLQPPAGVVAPSIFLDRSALGLFPGSHVDLSEFTRFPSSVQVQGQLERLTDGTPISGFVSLVSTEIAGMDAGIFGSFQTSVQSGADGLFTIQVPPGKYRVRAVPTAGGSPAASVVSAVEAQWDIPADVPQQAGKLLELPALAQVTGQARAQGAEVQAVPSPQIVLPFEQAFGAGPFSPRAASTLVDDAGRFVVQADPGQFDISVQPAEELGFAWFVRPGVQIGLKDQDLGRVVPPSPSLLTGVASLAGGDTVLASAAVRAYAYLDKAQAYTRDPKQAVSVVAVAETRAGEDGSFRLLIPSSIAAPR